MLLLILLVACPKPEEETFCAQGMILSSDTCTCIPNSHPTDDGESCECDSLYSWSDELNECLLDTTNSQFMWTIDTIGVFRTILRDVEYVNDHDIWVVGTINHMIPDSSGEASVREDFNIARWNGDEWEMLSAYHGSVELFSIIYFADDDIWVSSGLPMHWDGNSWTLFQLWDMGVLNMGDGDVPYAWGTSTENMYFVGSRGEMVHYDGTSFTKIESGTSRNLNSISGTKNGEHIFITGTNADKSSIILHLYNAEIHTIYEGEEEWSLPAGTPRSTSVYGDTVYFASGEGIWKYNYFTRISARIEESGSYEAILPRSIMVSSPNDIFMCGSRSEFVHFNGARWTSDFSVWGEFGYSGVGSNGMDVKGDHVVIVGYANGWQRGLIAHGRRN